MKIQFKTGNNSTAIQLHPAAGQLGQLSAGIHPGQGQIYLVQVNIFILNSIVSATEVAPTLAERLCLHVKI